MISWAVGVSLRNHRRTKKILKEADVENIVVTVRRRRLERFGRTKRRSERDEIGGGDRGETSESEPKMR